MPIFRGLPKSVREFADAPDYILIDLSRFSKKKILSLRQGYLVNTLLILKYSSDPGYMARFTREIFVYGDYYQTTEEGRSFIHGLLVYFFSLTNFDSKKLETVIERISEPVKRTVMTTLENIQRSAWKEGRKEGKEEGIEVGKQEGKIEIARQLLLKYPEWTDLAIAEITGLPEETVKQWRVELTRPGNGKTA